MKKTMSFSEVRKQSANLEQFQKKFSNKPQKDERFWRAEQDKAGNAQAVIRFLPTAQGDSDPFIKKLTHGFQGPTGKWFIEFSPETIGKPCPVREHNNALWNENTEESIKLARQRGQRKKYISNIYVVKDPANPENEGKVFLFEYGQKIFEKLENALNPKFDGDKPFNPFCMFDGADFKLRIVKKDGYANYDNSAFDTPSPLVKDDTEGEKIWNQQFSLLAWLEEQDIKDYDVLKEKLQQTLGETSSEVYTKTVMDDVEDDDEVVSKLTENEPESSSLDDDDTDSLDELDISDDDDDLEDLKSLVS